MKSARALIGATISGLLAATLSGPVAAAGADTVRTAAGTVQGSSGEIRIFRGIPFAAPPVGELRWKPPQPAAPWPGVRDATHFGSDCMQGPWDVTSGQSMSEDCLFLNVWTPAHGARARLPVMVFIYGGAFVGGSGALPLYEGTNLAKRGVVVVTLNYRLGVFGFLAHPGLTRESPHHSSGNYGLLDQIAGLRWVRANIAAFGGDPGKVTIFGESAGATSVTMLLLSPLAKGLFQGAIAESPALGWRFTTLAKAETFGAALNPDIAALRRMDAHALLADNLRIAPLASKVAPETYPFPIVDGWVVPDQPNSLFAKGRVNRAAFMTGDNADEGSMFADAWRLPSVAAYQTKIRSAFGPLAAEAIRLYPATRVAEVARAGADLTGDTTFYEGTRMVSYRMQAAGTPSFRYLFTHRSGHVPLHSDELRYVFGNLDNPGFTGQPAPTEADRTVSDTMMASWVRFARTGNPNGGGLPKWEAAAPGGKILEFADKPREIRGFRDRQLDFIERYYRSASAYADGLDRN